VLATFFVASRPIAARTPLMRPQLKGLMNLPYAEPCTAIARKRTGMTVAVVAYKRLLNDGSALAWASAAICLFR